MKSQPIVLNEIIICPCCTEMYNEVPAEAGFSDIGFFWNCLCGTTLAAPFKRLVDKKEILI